MFLRLQNTIELHRLINALKEISAELTKKPTEHASSSPTVVRQTSTPALAVQNLPHFYHAGASGCLSLPSPYRERSKSITSTNTDFTVIQNR